MFRAPARARKRSRSPFRAKCESDRGEGQVYVQGARFFWLKNAKSFFVTHCVSRLLFAVALAAVLASPCRADTGSKSVKERDLTPHATPAPAGVEERELEVAASPKKPWGDFTLVREHQGGKPWWEHVLLWLPNRVMDLIDVFRVDVGVGPAAGGIIRVTRYGQVGYREMMPGSLRVGDFGRDWPVMVEDSNEMGIGPNFIRSKDRKVCPGEIGVGADAFIVGAYGGICVEELLDFVAGIFFLDVMDDDIK